ncbi:hypothetical protein [Dyella subtropica]|uniref:hypothetical protein n=1 Tax=Dyella subtropica TaxID=2992127 RepID=UPI002259C4D9|nr:hypothetical protein [Dyella subtropica]
MREMRKVSAVVAEVEKMAQVLGQNWRKQESTPLHRFGRARDENASISCRPTILISLSCLDCTAFLPLLHNVKSRLQERRKARSVPAARRTHLQLRIMYIRGYLKDRFELS